MVDQVELGVVLHEGELSVDIPHEHMRGEDAVKLRVHPLVNLIQQILDAGQEVRGGRRRL